MPFCYLPRALDALSLRAATLLGLAGASLALFFQQIAGHWVVGFIARNELSLPNRRIILLTMAVGFAVMAGAALVVRAVRGVAVAPRLRAMAWVVSPLALCGLLPGLLRAEAWEPLAAGLALALVALLTEEAFTVAGRGWRELATVQLQVNPAPLPRWRRWWSSPGVARVRGRLRALGAVLAAPRGTLGAALVGWLLFGAVFAVLSVRLLRRGALPSTELGFWNAILNGTSPDTLRLFVNGWTEPLRGMLFHPTAWLLWLFSRGGNTGEALLVLRALVAASGGLFLWALAERRLPGGRRWLLLAAYFLWPAWQASLLSDFSLVPFAATFVLAALAAWSRREHVAAAVAFALALGCGEAGLALVFCVGIGALARPRTRPAGFVLAGIGALGTLVLAVVGASQPTAHVPALLQPFVWLWHRPGDAVRNWVSADRLTYLLMIATPLALLPLRGVSGGLVLLPGLVMILATHDLDGDYARAGLFVAFVMPALARTLAEARQARLVALVLTLVVSTSLWGVAPARKVVRAFAWLSQTDLRAVPDAEQHRHLAELNQAAAAAPPGLLLVPALELARVQPPKGVELGLLSRSFAPDAKSVLLGARASVPGFELTAPAHAIGFRFVKTSGSWSLFARQ